MTRIMPPVKLATVSLLATIVAGKSDIAAADVTVGASYRGDMMVNADGGIKTGSAYLDNAGLSVIADVPALFSAADATFYAYLLYNNGTTFSNRYPGDFQVTSNIDTTHGTRVYEFWYEQNWSEEYSLLVGLYDLNSEFDSIETAALFMNSSHGIGADYAQSGEAGPSIFPVTSLAARFEWQIDDSSTVRYSILDGVPGDPNDFRKTTIDLADGDGALNALEYDYVFPGGTRLALGAWHYTANFDLLEGEDASGEALRGDGNNGVYGFIDAPLVASETGGLTVDAFLRYGTANDEIHVLDSYFGAGIVASGLIESRPDDRIGFAVASARVGDTWKRVVAESGGSVESSETTFELTYSTQFKQWLRLQPTLQYVINPSASHTLKNALVLGLQFEISTGLQIRSN